MTFRILIFMTLAALTLAGCAAGGPTNAEANAVFYSVYFTDANILEKRQCVLTPEMQAQGETNVWLIRYRFKGSGDRGVMLVREGDTEEYPWLPYMTMAQASEEAIEASCP
jgi:hypothetical protein